MFSAFSKGTHKVLILVMTLGAVFTHRAETAELKVCIDQANPTAAMDLRVVRAAARTQGYSVNLHSFEGYGKGGDGLPVRRFAKMAQSDCEIIMGFPVDVSHPNLPPNVEATSAYASTGFVLIRRSGSAKLPLSDLAPGSEVGIVQLDTYAGLLFGTHPNIAMHVYPKYSPMLADLQAKHIVAALAWQPSFEIYESGHPDHPALRLETLPGAHMLWNLVALYVPQSQSAANLFDKGLYELQSKRQLAPLIKPYGEAAAAGAAHTAARWPAAHLQHAIARSEDQGRLLQVADTSGNANKKRAKIPALYTTEQAAQGALAYYQNCAMCHGPLLDGQPGGYSGPALKGADFADPSYDFHVSDIFNFVAKLMPSATPGSLTHEQDVEIMAFILQQNGYPPGNQPLVYEAAEKSKIPLRYYGK